MNVFGIMIIAIIVLLSLIIVGRAYLACDA